MAFARERRQLLSILGRGRGLSLGRYYGLYELGRGAAYRLLTSFVHFNLIRLIFRKRGFCFGLGGRWMG